MTPTRRGFKPLRDIPTVAWLAATVAVALAHTAIPTPRWLMIHLLLLGAVSHSVTVWSQHFADALLRTAPPRHRAAQIGARLAVLNAGAAAVVAGVVAVLWPLILAGASAIIIAGIAHAYLLAMQVKRSLPARFSAAVKFYIAAAAMLPFGAGIGALLARDALSAMHERLHVAHVTLNVMGWIGLTVLGTLITLWATVLGARIEQAHAALAVRALPFLAGGVVAAALGAVLDQRLWVTAGLAAYLVGVAMVVRGLWAQARQRPPVTYAALSIGAGALWWCAGLITITVASVTAPSWHSFAMTFDAVAPFLAAGFVAQVLLGALSYLIPTALGGGPASARVAHREFDRGAQLRIVIINAGILTYALPVPAAVRVAASMAVLAAFAAFLVLLARATRAWRQSRTHRDSAEPAIAPEVSAPWHARPRGQRAGMAATGLTIVALAIATGVALDPSSVVSSATAGPLTSDGQATGQVVKVHVTAADMRFTPDTITINAGDQLILTVENTDTTNVHDLVLDSGAATARLQPGQIEVLDLGVVSRSASGWCSVLGHRSMGMVLTVVVAGETAVDPPDEHSEHGMSMPGPGAAGEESAAAMLDFHSAPSLGFTAHDATLSPAGAETVHRRTFTVMEVEREIAPGVNQTLWTFNGEAPGPVMRGKIGDTFEITLVNDGSMGHSIDFHAGSLAPDDVMRTIAPGESLTYTFTAERAGIWMYHCSTMPMSAHIANGMYGAVIIDPPDLPEVDREFFMIQAEYYLGPQGGIVDFDKVRAETPDAVVFNGHANQYDGAPLQVVAGETVRVWVLAAGPNRGTSFHVIGTQFDAVYFEGSYQLERGTPGGSQALGLAVAQGGFVEFTFPEAGHYPFVSHLMIDAERGAHGTFEASAAPSPTAGVQ